MDYRHPKNLKKFVERPRRRLKNKKKKLNRKTILTCQKHVYTDEEDFSVTSLNGIMETSSSSEFSSDEESVDLRSKVFRASDKQLTTLTACNENDFHSKLKDWAVKNSVPLSYLSGLLKILVQYGNYKSLPLDARTFLETPRYMNVREMDNGFYVHLGIKNFLQEYFQYNIISSDTIWLSFSTDGTPVSESGASSLWPIFGALHSGILLRHVFEIGLFHGPSKPDSFNDFLSDFVDEIYDLTQNGYRDEKRNKTYNVKIKCFVADAPALASIKLVKSHGGYSSCTKCETKGHYSSVSRAIVYPDLNAPLRTDESFRKRNSFTADDTHYNYREHSILEKLPVDMINDFPLDKMHLVDEGVVKKILILLTIKVNRQKLPPKKIAIINNRLEKCANYMPIEFQRKPRSLKYVLKMKATEYRDFLLYTGPAVLKGIIPEPTFNHFLALSIGIRILSSPVYYLKYNEYAKALLITVVQLFPKIYGMHNVSYNVHGIIHLASDAKYHGPLDSYSCYAFESHIKKIKKMLHSKNKPLHQCYNRIKEKIKFEIIASSSNTNIPSSEIKLYDQLFQNSEKFFKANFSNFVIDARKISDNCILLKNNIVLRVYFFEKDEENTRYAVGHKLGNMKPLNGENCAKLFHLITGNFEFNLTKHIILEDNVLSKMCCLPYSLELDDGKYFVCPIIHTFSP